MSVNRHPNTQGVTIKQWRYTATGGETTLSGTDGFSQSLTYTAGAEEVFINGVLLVRGTDYTATTGTTVVLNNALVAGDIATVSAPSVFNVANTVPLATVAAKGDLIVGNGAASVTNLGVGADGSTLVANSSASTGVSWAGPIVTAGKNGIINGGMDIWQRGTTFTNPGSYAADRWTMYAPTTTVTQESSVVPTGFKYSMKLAATASTTPYAQQAIETANALQFAGQTVILSAYASASTATTLQLSLQYSTSVDNPVAGTWTSLSPLSSNGSAGTSGAFNRIYAIYSVPSTAKSLLITFNPTANIANGVNLYITGVQLELGSVATAFSRAGGTLQGELAACQRYYWRATGNSSSYIATIGAYSSTNGVGFVQNPVPMRIAATALDYSSLDFTRPGVGATPMTSLAILQSMPLTTSLAFSAASGLSGGTFGYLEINATNGYLGVSAEL